MISTEQKLEHHLRRKGVLLEIVDDASNLSIPAGLKQLLLLMQDKIAKSLKRKLRSPSFTMLLLATSSRRRRQ